MSDTGVYMEFKILTEITAIETIARGRGVEIRRHLERVFGKGNWRKMKGVATIELTNGAILEAELH